MVNKMIVGSYKNGLKSYAKWNKDPIIREHLISVVKENLINILSEIDIEATEDEIEISEKFVDENGNESEVD